MATNWPAIRAGIFKGESGGDYNTLYGHVEKSGPFAGTKLSDMTVDQALQFGSRNGPYGQWAASKGITAAPMGAYQIINSTLGTVKSGMGLSGNERMTPDLQEKMGQYIYSKQGTGAWAGYHGPGDPSAYPPPSPPLSPQAAAFVQNNPQPGGYGAGVPDPNAPPSPILGPSQQPSPLGIPGIPQDVAAYAADNSLTLGDRLQSAFKGLAKTPDAPAVRFGPMGDARQSGDSLLKALNAPTLSDLLSKKRLVG
ncbi:hypothetical protein EJ076_34750 [Mesorhizobium sp. M7D.F.Ca.US.005.01.1.1]|uniref:hypothetical protein n=1 Tax=Mesorhizobium sp. M7D.F.Ca.US.005.01.1.1 TaxID=2493678 RepID=UPI000F755CDB|nr:hypothetical protein [Mesorhizobium sp. M7D.F.Ca.US.005.01.1.1]AZO45879.1 hypothetical protein EJ076_34750 [Mesorhizobium sp. M7D.F.Ca.US.005.01.1.1]